MNVVSQTAEYALRAVVQMAQAAQDRPGLLLTAPFIAEQTQVPPGYLLKVLQTLCRAGFVRSRRGIGGGFELICNPDETTIYDIVDAVDEIPRIDECPLGNPEHQKLCPLHQSLDDAMGKVENAFKTTSISELLTGSPIFCSVKE